ncbi:hypothetical protein HYY72_03120 [Candidatus Woesearchaeota archaeon]|nr:hypothetical protein [Candidatus Woesearchaeota archaeon]
MKRSYLVFGLMVVFCIGVLVSPFFLRISLNVPLVFGEEPYYHARIAEEISGGNIAASDTLVYNSRPYYFGPFQVLLGYASLLIGLDRALVILPVIFGLLSFILFYLILGNFGITGLRRAIMSVLLASSPSFISTFTMSGPHSLAILLFLGGFYALMSRKMKFAGFAVLVSTIMFGLFNSMLLIVLLLGHYLAENRRKMFFLLLFFFSFIGSAAYYLLTADSAFNAGILSSVLSDFGGNGFGIFTILLLFAGVAFTWKQKYSYSIPYFLLLFLMTSLLFAGPFVLAYMGFVVAVFAGEGLYRIIRMRWEVSAIKSFTVLIIACGLMFSTASYVSRIANQGPSQETVSSLEWLKGEEPGTVFSHYSNGFWIEYFSKKPVLMDGFIVSDFRNRYNDSMQIFYSRNLDKTKGLLDRYDVKYIYIDSSMRNGRIWRNNDDGLLFLLGSNESFTRIYDSPDVQVWRYLGR